MHFESSVFGPFCADPDCPVPSCVANRKASIDWALYTGTERTVKYQSDVLVALAALSQPMPRVKK